MSNIFFRRLSISRRLLISRAGGRNRLFAALLGRMLVGFMVLVVAPVVSAQNPQDPSARVGPPGMPGVEQVHAFTELGIGVWLDPDGSWRLSGIAGLYNVEVAGHEHPADVPRHLLPTAEVYEVVDGDTVRVRFSGHLPPGIDDEENIRLLAADTPELNADSESGAYGSAAARDAAAFLRRLIAGRTVALAFENDYRDQFGRLLAYVFLESGLLINAELIRTGHAQVYRHIPTHFHDYFLELEARSRPRSASPVVIGRVFNEGTAEYVELLNVGEDAVDISGYFLEDAVGNRLVLPRGTRLAPGARLRIHSGASPEGRSAVEPQGEALYLSEDPIWNNSGDTILLKTPAGAVVLEYVY